MKAKLRVVGGRANRKEILLSLPTIVGRAKESGLCVRHPTVSRKHCELREEQGLLVVEDLGSSNGIAVGDKVVPRATLRPGDRVTIGPLTFEAHYQVNGVNHTATPPQATASGVAPLADTEVESDFDFLSDDADLAMAPLDEEVVVESAVAEVVEEPEAAELEIEEEFSLGELDLADSTPAPSAPAPAPAAPEEAVDEGFGLDLGDDAFDLAPIDDLAAAPAPAAPAPVVDEAPDEFALPDDIALDLDDIELSDASAPASGEQAPGESGLKLHETLEFDLDEEEEPAALSAAAKPVAKASKAQPESKKTPAPPSDEGTLDGLDDWLGLSE